MNFSRITYLTARVIAIASCALIAMPASAALLFSEPRQIEAAPNQEFEVRFFLDTQDEDINALEGTLEFPADLLELKEIRDGGSIVNFWIERPTLSQTPVAFSGIIPGGYRFPKGLVLSLVFAAKGNGAGVIHIEKARTLRNDGSGTEAPLTLAFSSVVVSTVPESPAPPVSTLIDTDAPESFRPERSRDASVFDGKWFLAFATQDKGTGIDHFEVQESYSWGWGAWIRVSSPYVFVGQDPSLPVRVKAVDRAGNERIENVAPVPHVRTLFESVLMLGIMILVIMMLLVVHWNFRKRGKK